MEGQRQNDAVNHPRHYNSHPAGMECIELVELLPFCEGNAIKYLWRAGLKGAAVEDLQKARWYVERAYESPDFELTDAISNASDKACDGFTNLLVASAIAHICVSDYALAIRCIDALIEQVAMEAA